MSERTPGPWSVNTSKDYENGKPCYIWGPKGPGHGIVCAMGVKYPREFNTADAHLIAAAPEMLGALASLVLAVEHQENVHEALKLAKEVINKALGKP